MSAHALKFKLVAAGILLALAATFGAEPGTAGPREGKYLRELSDLPRGLSLRLKDEKRTITLSHNVLKERVLGSLTDPYVDPIELSVPTDPGDRIELVELLARPGRTRDLQRYLDRKVAKQTLGNDASPPAVTVRVDPPSLPLFDLDALAAKYARIHHHLTVWTAPLRKRATLRNALLNQMRPFFSDRELAAVQNAIEDESSLDADRLLLPIFARRTVGRFTKYRGPNCFMTALAFQDPQLPQRPDVNSRVEKGYHRAMINHDELWWTLTREFVEIDPQEESLRYGDVLVFMDVPDPTRPVDYHWIKHASSYLFGEYTFSKESNSPSSPYSVKTLAEEWGAWARRTENLGVKVFRHQPQRLTANAAN